MQFPEDVEKAYQAALQVRLNAYAPYSKFAVGAALQIEGESEPIAGCNVENASYGATICAERSAIFQAVARHGRIRPQFIVVVTNEHEATVPCANCLQVMAEFCADETKIYLGNEAGLQKLYALKELLPYPFRNFSVIE